MRKLPGYFKKIAGPAAVMAAYCYGRFPRDLSFLAR